MVSPSECVPGPHHGTIEANETWCAGDSPHVLSSSVVVNPGVVLTIEAGATVMGSNNAELKVLGHLSAIGTADQPILLTSLTNTGPIQWAGLSFDGGTGDLRYVTVRYGGNDGNSLGRGNVLARNVTAGQVKIQNSTISDVDINFYLNTVRCLDVINSHVTVINTTFTGCASVGGQWGSNYPIYISGADSVATLKDNIFVNNYKDRIALEPGALVGHDFTLWPQAVNGAYELVIKDTENFTIPAGITMNIQAGVTIMGNQGRELLVQGGLDAFGTPTQPVIFTSVNDSQPGSWSGIVFDGGFGTLSHTIIRNGGGANSSGWRAGVTVNNVQTERVSLYNSIITENGGGDAYTVSHGMVINNSKVSMSDCKFTNNGKPGGGYYGRNYALYLTGPSTRVDLVANEFTGNSRDKIGITPGTFDSAQTITLSAQAVLDGYEFDGSYTIPNGHTLILEPGVSLSGRGPNDELLVLGHLEAVGTPDHPITFTSGDDSAWKQWPGVIFNGGTGHLSYVHARYGGIQNSLQTYGTLNAINVPLNGLVIENSQISDSFYYGLYIYDSTVAVTGTHFVNNGENPRDNDTAIYAYGDNTQLTLSSSVFEGNARDLMLYKGTSTLTNNAFLGEWTKAYDGYHTAVALYNNASATMLHNTISHKKGSGVYVDGTSSVTLTNSIFAQNTYAVYVEAGGLATLDATLWDRNYANIAGAANETHSYSGIAGFAEDGYHLTRYSMAIGYGIDAGIHQDIDGEDRPQPAGTYPDLGADEYPYILGKDFAAELFAFNPQWVILPNPQTGNPSGMLRQGYFLRYFYGSTEAAPPPLVVNVTNTLPDQLLYESQQTSPAMTFSSQGQDLNWQSVQPLQKDTAGEIIFTGLYGQPVPGDVLVDQATLGAGRMDFSMQASTKVPLFPPLVTFPGNGEICTGPGNTVNLTVTGAAQNSAIVKFYEGNTYVGQTTATTEGMFSFTYTSSQVGVYTTTLSARACLPSSPDECSQPFEVFLTPQQSLWDPQLSYWEFFNADGTSVIMRFRRNGVFSTQNSIRPKGQGFPYSVLHLYICQPADDIQVFFNDKVFVPEKQKSRSNQAVLDNWLGETKTYLSEALKNPCSLLHIRLVENGYIKEDSTCSLVDPDGYVYDVTKGFDPLEPALQAIEGITVTCMYSSPAWGGWIPWPAQFYDHQVNPQVTKADGHFSFFTPSGFYYLQVDGGDKYQSWRSPVIQVISDVVHLNVPLTPLPVTTSSQIILTEAGPDTTQITIPANSSVTWHFAINGITPLEETIPLMLNPRMHIRSSLDPETSIYAWDSGLLVPGQSYSRHFTRPGTYTYTDGYGHTGQITVEPYRVFLPVIFR